MPADSCPFTPHSRNGSQPHLPTRPPAPLHPRPHAELGQAALQSIHTECDVHGTRLLQRYADYRRLPRIAGQIGMRKRDDTTAEAAPVEPRQVGGRGGRAVGRCALLFWLAGCSERAAAVSAAV